MRSFGLAAAFAAILAVAMPATAPASPMPPGWKAQNVTPVGYADLHPGRAFKLTLKPANGHWYLFVAMTEEGGDPGGFEIVDVTDPARPKSVRWISVPHGSGQITLHGDLMLVGTQLEFTARGGPNPFAGTKAQDVDLVQLWDVKDPANPVKLSAFRARGFGTHRNLYPGGRYAYLSAFLEGYHDQSILMAIDVSDPKNPKEAWRWWQPGQRDDEVRRYPGAMAYHGPPQPSDDGKMLTVGYAPRIVNFDITGPEPKEIGSALIAPLQGFGPTAMHTVASLPNGFLHVTSEVVQPGCDREHVPVAEIWDNTDPVHPRMAAHYPRPIPPKGSPWKTFCEKDGRFGPHNINAETHLDYVTKPDTIVYQTYFNAGLRIYDISDPYFPTETGWFLPTVGAWSAGARGLEDVLVDKRGNAFVTNGREHGVWIVRYTGPHPAASVKRGLKR